MVASVPVTVAWLPRVPSRTTATGVVAARPPATSASAISPSRPTPMRMTSVPPARASAAQSTSDAPLVGSSWPVTTVKRVETPRCVTGMPA